MNVARSFLEFLSRISAPEAAIKIEDVTKRQEKPL